MLMQFPMRVRCIDAMPGRLTQGMEYVATNFSWFGYGNAFFIRDEVAGAGGAWFRVERFKPIVRVKMGRAAA